MKILFLSDNFTPESNAPAIRTHDHTRRWVEMGHEVVVVTCAPNFPRGVVFDGYRNALYARERIDGVEVVRVWSYIAANEGFFKRILDYTSFMVTATIAALFVKRPDVIVATSPQFFAAVAGWIVSTLKRRPFVFELRDLWPESIVAVGASSGGFLIDRLEAFAGYLYRRAELMVPVTRSFAEHLRGRGVAEDRIEVVTNGIDVDAVSGRTDPAATRKRLGLPEDAFIGAFIGTIGMAHGIGTVIEAAARTRDDPSLHYLVMGEGADKQHIRAEVAARALGNVTLLDGRPRAEALDVLAAADASLVLLRDTPTFRTVIPSKIFEAMALARPIVLGVRGEAHRIVIEDGACGVAFPPEDVAGLVEALRTLAGDAALCRELGARGRERVAVEFDRGALAERMATRLEALAKC